MTKMDFKSYFEIPSNITYLNTAGNGILPKSHHAWRRNWERDFFDLKGDLRDQQSIFIKGIKEEFSSLFGCLVERLFLVPNFSFGYNTLLDGLDKSLRFVLLEEDYPSLNYPVISRGFEHVVLPVSEGLEDDIYQYIKINNADVLALSVVNYITGFQVSLDFIKKLRNDFPDLLILADATQYLGIEPFDFEKSGFDAVGGSGYKWMMAGFGNGYMMLSERLKNCLYVDAQQKEKPTVLMWSHKSILDIYFEPGHQDTLSQGTLGQSVAFFKKVGLANIQSYLKELKEYAYSVFADRNWLLPSIVNREDKSTLINLQIDTAIYPFLLEQGIKCFPRGTGIRIGLHLYNTKEDIDRLVDVINSYKK